MEKNKRDNFLGIRLTKDERTLVEKVITKYNYKNSATFIREAIFTHIGNLTKATHSLDIQCFRDVVLKIRQSSFSIMEIADSLQKELNSLDIIQLIGDLDNEE